LALLPLLASSQIAVQEDGVEGWATGLSGGWKAAIVGVAVVLVVFIGRYVVGPLMRMVIRTGMRELVIATSLLLLAGIAFLMVQVGLSPALGAFMAGVVLASSEFKHQLESDLEPFKGLLLGLFFIAVGASLNIAFIASNAGGVFEWVGTLMAVKMLVLFVLGRIFKLSLDQNAIFSLALAQMGEFAFVLFSVTGQLNLLSTELTNLMTAVVAISIACTPVLFLIAEKWILPYVGVRRQPSEQQSAGAGNEVDEKHPVIIAGFGRMGNIIGRFLHANGIASTVLDYDSDRVHLLRKYGFKVYYGDATRLDMLHAAGASNARIIIISLDDHDSILRVSALVQKHFPHLTIVARAKGRDMAYELIEHGVEHVYRETLDTSLRMSVDVMTMLGYAPDRMQQAAQRFRAQDERAMRELAGLRRDSGYASLVRAKIEELEQLMRADETHSGHNSL